MSQCRSCGQAIKWIKTEANKNMPCDPDEIDYAEAEQGDVLITETGKVFKVDHKNTFPNVTGYVSHFATCPQADEWRKK